MTRETFAGAVVNRIVVAHNRLRRSEITAAEFDQFAIEKLLAFADAEAAAMRERAEADIIAKADRWLAQQYGLRPLAADLAAIRALPATGEVGRG